MRNHQLPASVLRRLAVLARCDPRTIARVHAGGSVRGDAAIRAREVLEREGLVPKTKGAPWQPN